MGRETAPFLFVTTACRGPDTACLLGGLWLVLVLSRFVLEKSTSTPKSSQDLDPDKPGCTPVGEVKLTQIF